MFQGRYNKTAILSLVSTLSVVAFLILGFVYGLWHPGWLVFFATPITTALLNVIDNNKQDDSKNDSAAPHSKS